MKKICLGFLAEAVILSAVVLVWFAIFGNTPETYPDVIIEWTARSGNNKSIDMHLVWLLVVLTICLTSGLYYFSKKESLSVELKNRFFQRENYLATAFLAYVLTSFLLYHRWVITFCCAAVIALITAKWRKEYVWEASFGGFFVYFALFGLCALIGWAVPHRLSVRLEVLEYLSFFAVAGLLKYRPHLLGKCISFTQIFVPMGLLALLGDKYMQQGREYIIQNPWQATGIILLVTVAACIFSYRKYRALLHGKQDHPSLEERISLWACFAVYMMNSYYPNGLHVVSDPHHPIENIIGFSQIFELGQMPFTQYTPTSGMYSVVHGAFVYLFGNDLLSNYGIATNVLLLGIGGLTIYLLQNLIQKRYLFLFSILFNLVAFYDRVWFILPVIFLLMQPKILSDPAKMIVAWLLSSLFMGLYYPLYGAAVCLGFVPIALYHVWTWKKEKHPFTWKALLPWGLTGLLILLALPLLFGLAQHMLAMRDQTIWADGIGAFAQMTPSWFLLFLKSWTLRMAAFEILIFLFPMVPLAIGTWFLCGLFRRYRAKDEVRLDEMTLATLMMTVSVVSFTYTFVRLDYDGLFSRLAYILVIEAGLFFLYGIRFLTDPAKKICIVITMVCVAAMAQPPARISGSFSNFYDIPGEFVYVDEEFPKSGKGFMTPTYYHDVKRFERFAYSDTPVFSLPLFAKWYLLAIPGVSTLEAGITKGYPAADEAVHILKTQKPLIGTGIDPYEHYYLYHWIVTSGAYRYSAEDQMFYPQQDGGTSSNKEVTVFGYDGNFGSDRERNLINAPEATGESMNSLRKNFSAASVRPDVIAGEEKTEIVWPEAVDGDQADFVYVELEAGTPTAQYGGIKAGVFYPAPAEQMNPFSPYVMFQKHNPDKMIRVSWLDDQSREHAFQMDFGQGKLLIPLGAGMGWLLNQHDRISITCLKDGKPIPIQRVNHIEFLKLRTVE